MLTVYGLSGAMVALVPALRIRHRLGSFLLGWAGIVVLAPQMPYAGTQIFERFYTVGDLVQSYLSLLKTRAEEIVGEPIDAATLGRVFNRLK